MPEQPLKQRLDRKNANHDRIAATVIRNRRRLPELFAGLSAERASVKYGSAKVLRIISEQEPALLYPAFDSIVALLDQENKILRWAGLLMIGNLASVDSKRKIDKKLGKLLAPIPGPDLVTAANAIGAAAQVARAKPALADEVVEALLGVQRARYRTSECRQVAAGRVIEALEPLYDRTKHKRRIATFVRKQLRSPRDATRKKAERFAKRRLSDA